MKNEFKQSIFKGFVYTVVFASSLFLSLFIGNLVFAATPDYLFENATQTDSCGAGGTASPCGGGPVIRLNGHLPTGKNLSTLTVKYYSNYDHDCTYSNSIYAHFNNAGWKAATETTMTVPANANGYEFTFHFPTGADLADLQQFYLQWSSPTSCGSDTGEGISMKYDTANLPGWFAAGMTYQKGDPNGTNIAGLPEMAINGDFTPPDTQPPEATAPIFSYDTASPQEYTAFEPNANGNNQWMQFVPHINWSNGNTAVNSITVRYHNTGGSNCTATDSRIQIHGAYWFENSIHTVTIAAGATVDEVYDFSDAHPLSQFIYMDGGMTTALSGCSGVKIIHGYDNMPVGFVGGGGDDQSCPSQAKDQLCLKNNSTFSFRVQHDPQFVVMAINGDIVPATPPDTQPPAATNDLTYSTATPYEANAFAAISDNQHYAWMYNTHNLTWSTLSNPLNTLTVYYKNNGATSCEVTGNRIIAEYQGWIGEESSAENFSVPAGQLISHTYVLSGSHSVGTLWYILGGQTTGKTGCENTNILYGIDNMPTGHVGSSSCSYLYDNACFVDSGTLLHNPEFIVSSINDDLAPPTTRNPILIIPGIMGSELLDQIGGLMKTLWLDPATMLSNYSDLFLNNQGQSNGNISVGGVIKSVPINNTDVFSGLETKLLSEGYIQDQSLFYFPYDWRLDIDGTKDSLKAKIDQIKSLTGAAKVDIVAHSMGGLVVEDYIKSYGKDSVGKLVFVGTPHLGAPKALPAIIYGTMLNVKIPFISDALTKPLAVNSPSIYELLPNKHFFSAVGGYITRLLFGSQLNAEDSKQYVLSNGGSESIYSLADNLSEKDLPNIDLSGLDVYDIIGCGSATPIAYYMPTVLGSVPFRYGQGDNTVPSVSSENVLGQNYTERIYVNGADHSGLPSRQDVRNAIAAILSGGQINQSPSLALDNSVCSPISGLSFMILSPLSPEIYDGQGRRSG